MKSRAEAVKFIMAQFNDEIEPMPHSAYHYGKCELRQLMDFIYDGLPVTDDECLGEPLKLRNAKAGKWV